jgi:thiamine-monophosphate kinase
MDTEAQLIERITRAVPSRTDSFTRPGKGGASLRLGIGDDAAVLAPDPRRDLIWTCDAFLEGIHFLGNTHPPDSVGFKSLVRATSDIAAMGGVPRLFLLTLALPAKRTGLWLDQFLTGMGRAARSLRVRLAGGDTTRAPLVFISVAVLGDIASGLAIPRSGARPGDLIYVSGRLGRAQLGLELIRRGAVRWKSADQQLRRLLQPHLYPKIRLELGAWLARHDVASAMIDISDGLSTDLGHVCTESGVGARVWAERIPRRCTQAGEAPPRPAANGFTWGRGLRASLYRRAETREAVAESTGICRNDGHRRDHAAEGNFLGACRRTGRGPDSGRLGPVPQAIADQ